MADEDYVVQLVGDKVARDVAGHRGVVRWLDVRAVAVIAKVLARQTSGTRGHARGSERIGPWTSTAPCRASASSGSSRTVHVA